LKQQVSW